MHVIAEPNIRRAELLRTATARNFDGGWNVVDSDLNLSSKYAKRLRNIFRAADGSLQVRFGTKLFATFEDILATGVRIVNVEYYHRHIVAAISDGTIYAVRGNGTKFIVWNDAVAANLPGAPAGWGAHTFCSFTTFKNELIIANGLDKPLIVHTTMACEYLADQASNLVNETCTTTTANSILTAIGSTDLLFAGMSVSGSGIVPGSIVVAVLSATSVELNFTPTAIATGVAVQFTYSGVSNLFTPIGKFVRAHDNFVCIAGDPTRPGILSISHGAAAGTWLGDPPPNDAIEIDLGAYVPVGSAEITGLGSFRDKLVVTFGDAILILTLGTFTADVHVPNVEDAIEAYGSLSHRAIQSLGDDMLAVDNVGVPGIKRALFTGSITPERASELIDPEIQAALSRLSEQTIAERVFAVYNKLQAQYLLFIPDDNVKANTKHSRCYMYSSLEANSQRAWSEVVDWNWVAGCRSLLGTLFFANDQNIYILGDETNPFARDFIGEEETFTDNTTFTDGHGWTPVADEEDSGVPINFDWIMPWTDLKSRLRNKKTKYMHIDSVGRGRFTLDMFTDNFLLDRDDPGEQFTDGTLFDDDLGWDKEVFDPTLSVDLVGGSYLGVGQEDFGEYFGGGRTTGTEKLYKWPAKFRIVKHRFHGSTLDPLRFVSFTLLYHEGSIRR